MGIFSKVFNKKKNNSKENTDYKSTKSYLTGVKYKDVEIEIDLIKKIAKIIFMRITILFFKKELIK